MTYDNTPTVVVVRVPMRGGLLMVRRALPGDGFGKLALPGGYQMRGQTWQQAGAAEVMEEAGVKIAPTALRIASFETTPDGSLNILVADAPDTHHAGAFVHDGEVSEVVVVTGPVEAAFPIHTSAVAGFFRDAKARVASGAPDDHGGFAYWR